MGSGTGLHWRINPPSMPISLAMIAHKHAPVESMNALVHNLPQPLVVNHGKSVRGHSFVPGDADQQS